MNENALQQSVYSRRGLHKIRSLALKGNTADSQDEVEIIPAQNIHSTIGIHAKKP